MKTSQAILFTAFVLSPAPLALAQIGPGGPGGGRFPEEAAGVTTTSNSTGPIAQVQATATGATVTFSYNSKAAALGLGTTGESDFLVQSPEAINIPANIRVSQNNRDASARGKVVPITLNVNAGEGFDGPAAGLP